MIEQRASVASEREGGSGGSKPPGLVFDEVSKFYGEVLGVNRVTLNIPPGITSLVGPNGSGKSNLADALRWALGEQGRALRSRKAEDVIWAGSERRAAQGMADVTILLDNADGLLPVDYQVLELGRRLYRSGENDYLLVMTDAHAVSPAIDARTPSPEEAAARVRELAQAGATTVTSDWAGLPGVLSMVVPHGPGTG